MGEITAPTEPLSFTQRCFSLPQLEYHLTKYFPQESTFVRPALQAQINESIMLNQGCAILYGLPGHWKFIAAAQYALENEFQHVCVVNRACGLEAFQQMPDDYDLVILNNTVPRAFHRLISQNEHSQSVIFISNQIFDMDLSRIKSIVVVPDLTLTDMRLLELFYGISLSDEELLQISNITGRFPQAVAISYSLIREFGSFAEASHKIKPILENLALNTLLSLWENEQKMLYALINATCILGKVTWSELLFYYKDYKDGLLTLAEVSELLIALRNKFFIESPQFDDQTPIIVHPFILNNLGVYP